MKKTLQQTITTYDKIVENYVKKTTGLEPKKKLEHFKSSLSQGARVLDAGCGWGKEAKILAKKFKVIGVDLSQGLLDYAKQYAPQAEFRYGNVLKLDFPDKHFDGLWSNAVLLHLEREDVPRALKEFRRVLKPGGVAYISVKIGKSEGFKTETMSSKNPRFFTWFSLEEFRQLLLDAEFEITKFYEFAEGERMKLKRNLGVICSFVKKK